MASKTCNICCDEYNKSTRAKVSCVYCEFEVCRTCCETYILSEIVPKCMRPECAKEWSRKFLRENFTNTFLNSRYKEHVENVLFDQEKSLMPATQHLVEERIRRHKVMKEMQAIDKLIQDLYREKRELERSMHGEVKASTGEFVRQCPANGCRGFLSTQWKCGICEQWTCPDCHELKGPRRDVEHTCDPNSVETAKLLAKDSKPCPKCQSLIFKISGCDQMWCTQCHTAFSWKTGKLEKHIHNPHYYEWQRQQAASGAAPRVAGDVECGRDLQGMASKLYIAAQRHTHLGKPLTKNLLGTYMYEYDHQVQHLVTMVRNMLHIVHVEMVPFQTDYVGKNQDLRVRYLENEISEEEFKTLIQRGDKRGRKNVEIAQVMQLANTALTDIMYRCLAMLQQCPENEFELEPFFIEIDAIRKYCNNIFVEIAYTYCTTQYMFDDEFEFIRVAKEKRVKIGEIVDTSD